MRCPAVLLVTIVVIAWTADGLSSQHQQFFRLRPNDTEVVEGHTVRLYCEVGNQVGSVQWSKDGFVLGFERDIPGYPRYSMEGDYAAGIHTLLIESAQIEDDADYQCQVGPSGHHKAIRTDAHLTVLLPPKSAEIVGYENGTVKEVRQQDTITLNCVVRGGKPAASIKWYRKNIEIRPETVQFRTTERDDGRTDSESRLTLTPNPDDNGAPYTCEASHKALLMPLRRTVQLSVLFPPGPPEITGYQEGELVRMSDTLTLTCTSRGGNPLATLNWYKNDRLIDASYSTTGRLATNIYNLLVEPNDNNAIYRCEASNVVSPQPMISMVKLTVHFAPAKVSITGPKEAKAGDVVTMLCSTARSNPPADVSWVVDGRPITADNKVVADPEGGWITSANISITITERERNMKMFSCYAINQALGETIVETSVLSILYPPNVPSIFGYEESKSIRAGNQQKLNCVTQGGNPLPTLKWYKQGKEISSSSSSNGNVVSSDLTINTNKSDNGAEYTCEAFNSATSSPLVARIRLNVNFPPSAVTIKVEPQRPKAGKKVKLTCESMSSNPASTISWWRDGFMIPHTHEKVVDGLYGGKVTHNVLHLNVTAGDDGAVYTCQATNHLLQINVHDAITLSVNYKPEFVQSPQEEFTIVEGESSVINLTAQANPSAISYTWYRNGAPIQQVSMGGTRSHEQNDISGSHVSSNGPVLNFSGVQKADTGNYTCKAQNDEGFSEHTIVVSVQYAAVVTKLTAPVTVEEYENVQLECLVDAVPVTENLISWSRNNFDMTRTETTNKGLQSILTIYNITSKDSGDFQCIANNGIGKPDTKTVTIVVKHSPQIDRSAQWAKAASEAGQTARIICRASGSPQVTFSWYREGGLVSEKTSPTKYSIETTTVGLITWESVLTLNNVRSKDYGHYECVARNDLGFDSFKIPLEGTSKPDTPIALKVLNSTYNGFHLRWVPGFNGGLQQSFRIRYSRADSKENSYHYRDVSPAYATEFMLTGLDLATEYILSIRAFNKLGESDFLEDVVKAKTTAERPVTETERVVTEVLSGKGEIPRLIIISVSVVGSLLLVLNVILVVCFVRKRRKKRLEEETDQSSSKAATIEMYAPSSYNETVNGETLSSTSEKSEGAYSDGHSTGGYSEEPGKPAASTYLIDQGDGMYIADGSIPQFSPYRYPDEVISTLNHSPKLPHRAIIEGDGDFYVDALRRNAYNQRLGDTVIYSKGPPPPPGRTAASGGGVKGMVLSESEYGLHPDTRYVAFPVSPVSGPRLTTFSPALQADEMDGHLV